MALQYRTMPYSHGGDDGAARQDKLAIGGEENAIGSGSPQRVISHSTELGADSQPTFCYVLEQQLLGEAGGKVPATVL
jgi:hypothetical protein